jgi:hypothetical protein
MEALAYIWVYLLTGTLPWTSLCEENTRETCASVLHIKSSIAPASLCASLPPQFVKYLKRVRELAFEEEPPYAEFRAGFRALFIRLGFVCDYKYDWVHTDDAMELPIAGRFLRPQLAKLTRPLRPNQGRRVFVVAMEGNSQEEEFPQRRRSRPRLDGGQPWKMPSNIAVRWAKPPLSERRSVRLMRISSRA